jgi:YesN/AraC family two-component response regulator
LGNYDPAWLAANPWSLAFLATSELMIGPLNRIYNHYPVDKIYRQTDMDLKKAAAMLSVKQYTFSNILNTHYRRAFKDCPNRCRIEEAKQLLIDEPGISVLSKCFYCRF